jgi:hypothetical protein
MIYLAAAAAVFLLSAAALFFSKFTGKKPLSTYRAAEPRGMKPSIRINNIDIYHFC